MKAHTKGLAVFVAVDVKECAECRTQVEVGELFAVSEGEGGRSLLCLGCADLDHLVYLPSGNTALTRRASRSSTLWAKVLKWSRARKRFERQGTIVEKEALAHAESECLEDAAAREHRRVRDSERRSEEDERYILSFAGRIRELFAGCPPDVDLQIARRACEKHSGRVGRSANAKALDENAVNLAVVAHVRHAETNYDDLLMEGWDRHDAREAVAERVIEVLERWSGDRTTG